MSSGSIACAHNVLTEALKQLMIIERTPEPEAEVEGTPPPLPAIEDLNEDEKRKMAIYLQTIRVRILSSHRSNSLIYTASQGQKWRFQYSDQTRKNERRVFCYQLGKLKQEA